jgi:hypothetical protein
MKAGAMLKPGLLLVAVAATVACAAPPYRQDVAGVVTRDGKPVATLAVRFISDPPADTCETSGAEAVTDAEGRFGINRMYVPSIIESVAVVVHPYRLCVMLGGAWKLLWKTTTGPAPSTLQLECVLIAEVDGKCRASWNKQAFIDTVF